MALSLAVHGTVRWECSVSFLHRFLHDDAPGHIRFSVGCRLLASPSCTEILPLGRRQRSAPRRD